MDGVFLLCLFKAIHLNLFQHNNLYNQFKALQQPLARELFSLRNDTEATISYFYRLGNDDWKKSSLEAGASHGYAWNYSSGGYPSPKLSLVLTMICQAVLTLKNMI
jgi:hypothetical protein